MTAATDRVALTAAGEQRRAAMRAALQRVVARRGRRRRGWQIGAVLVAVAIGGVAAAWRAGAPRPVAAVGAAAAVDREPWRVVTLRDDATIATRLAAAVGEQVPRLDDRALLQQLRAAGRPTGVARCAGQVLLPGLVVDHWSVDDAH